MEVNYHPNLSQLKNLENWLKEEQQMFNQGFYCNWQIIKDCYAKSRLILFSDDSIIVGFLAWSSYSNYVNIDLMEIHPAYRGNGIGSTFYGIVERHFVAENKIAIKLFCEPEESENFWKKMGFRKFPNRGYSESQLTYYKPLINVCEPSEVGMSDRLELWNAEPHQVKNSAPKWIWNVNEKMDPILQPANGDWNLKLTRDGIAVKEDKVKYFSNTDDLLIGPFLYFKL